MQLNTSWEKVSGWYEESTGKSGNYYHREVVLPNVLRLLGLNKASRLLDLACGQGVLARAIPKETEYLGIDLSVSLIEEARKLDNNRKHSFGVADVTGKLPIRSSNFSHAAIILALQNISHPFKVIKNASEQLMTDGKLVIVINHPCFRIAKLSCWQIDKEKMIQYRRIDGYMSPTRAEIESSPFDKKDNVKTISFHYPLSAIIEMLTDNGFAIGAIEEWVSPKKSEGKMAKMEDKARSEFPMFMGIVSYRR